jgi:hypothetical protein
MERTLQETIARQRFKPEFMALRWIQDRVCGCVTFNTLVFPSLTQPVNKLWGERH